jgi:hypothetical protein
VRDDDDRDASVVWSSTLASAAFLRIDAMVFKAEVFRLYDSLVATTCPLLATTLKRYCPLLPFLTTNFIITTSGGNVPC